MHQIGRIGNYYGNLTVKAKDGRFWWSIEDHTGHDWQEIPKSLYTALMEFESEECEGEDDE